MEMDGVDVTAPGSPETKPYPSDHWVLLSRFVEGVEHDPQGQFNLAEDEWDARRYAAAVYPPDARLYKFPFRSLKSWLKPYVKFYCYQRLLGKAGAHSTRDAKLPHHLSRADHYITENKIKSLDEFVIPGKFEGLWAAQLTHTEEKGRERLTANDVWVQKRTRSFWLYISSVFGSPRHVPPVAPYTDKPLADVGTEVEKLIPDPVIRQLVNILALHRDGIEPLNRHHHLRLCVLLLLICVGRRVTEVLAAPICEGPEGPLERYPCRAVGGDDGGVAGEALWFRFTPNKNGRSDRVYISPEWEDLAYYCVHQLIRYSDEIRHLASPEEQQLLILVSAANLTEGDRASHSEAQPEQTWQGITAENNNKGRAKGLSYAQFNAWLNGRKPVINGIVRNHPGVLEKWHVMTDGSAESPHYIMNTGYARHTRQSALASNPQIPLTARKRDLNHQSLNTQSAYQHVLQEENESLAANIMKGTLHGRNMSSLDELLGLSTDGQQVNNGPKLVTLLSPSMEALIKKNPLYFERNIVDLGLCLDGAGSEFCEPYNSYSGRDKAREKRMKEKVLAVLGGESEPDVPESGGQLPKHSPTLQVEPDLPAEDRQNVTGNAPPSPQATVEKLKGRLQDMKKRGL